MVIRYDFIGLFRCYFIFIFHFFPSSIEQTKLFALDGTRDLEAINLLAWGQIKGNHICDPWSLPLFRWHQMMVVILSGALTAHSSSYHFACFAVANISNVYFNKIIFFSSFLTSFYSLIHSFLMNPFKFITLR